MKHLLKALEQCPWTPTVVLSGRAPNSPDILGEQWAKANGVLIETYPAKWKERGRSAGILRNIEMGEKGEALLAIWDGESPGTKHMIELARKKGLQVFIYMVDTPPEGTK